MIVSRLSRKNQKNNMGAKVFISWSGDLSKALGEAFRDWIPKVLQSVKPYFTPDDIEKGARWAKEIGQELSSSQLGIICLTQDNQHSPWILFEAGALSKNLEESKVCPLLFNMDTTDLKGPLSAFQATKFNKEDVKKLLESINSSCEETKLDTKSLDETFDMWWPKLEEKINEILSSGRNSSVSHKRSDRDIMEEILELTRSNAKSILSDEKRISRLTIEDLVHHFRRIKDKVSQDKDINEDLAQMESSIIRLCKEGNFEDIFFRRSISNPYGFIRTGVVHRDKNSVGGVFNSVEKNNPSIDKDILGYSEK